MHELSNYSYFFQLKHASMDSFLEKLICLRCFVVVRIKGVYWICRQMLKLVEYQFLY